ncbi:MAG TPA: Gfo/Idh/MocA family oxidoreductase [Mycobacteriales bacterium]|nr:Gfo/Idh/MocA family oxidoreductase [Mycobacteriales bacterium]
MGRRVLVIGAGWVARHVHLPRLLASGQVSELTVTDLDPAASGAVAREFGIAQLTPGRAAPADLVVITTPPASHAALATEALSRGVDVAVEKPLATDAADAVALSELAARQGRRLHVFHTPRYRADVRLLTELVRSGRLGDIGHCSVRWLRRSGVPATAGTRADGLVWDLGAHLADLVTGLLPAGVAGTVVAGGRRAEVGRDDVAGWYPPGAAAFRPRLPELVDVRAAAVLAPGWTLALHAAWACSTARDRVEVEVVGSAGHARLQTLFGLSPDRQRLRGPALTVTDARSGRQEALVPLPSHQPTEYDAQWAPVWSAGDGLDDLAQSVRTVALCAAIQAAVTSETAVAIPAVPAAPADAA